MREARRAQIEGQIQKELKIIEGAENLKKVCPHGRGGTDENTLLDLGGVAARISC